MVWMREARLRLRLRGPWPEHECSEAGPGIQHREKERCDPEIHFALLCCGFGAWHVEPRLWPTALRQGLVLKESLEG